jgi:hypothetical protein
MTIEQFMQALRANPGAFQVIAQDGGGNMVAQVDGAGNIVAQFPEAEVTGYRYGDNYQAEAPTGTGDGIAVADADKRQTLQQAYEGWARSQMPQAGITFQQYLRDTGSQVDAQGRVTQTISKDFGLADKGSFGDFLKWAAPKALAMYGGVQGLGNLLGGEALAGLSGAGGGAGAGSMFDAAGAGADMFGQGAVNLGNYGAAMGGAGGIGSALQGGVFPVSGEVGLDASMFDAAGAGADMFGQGAVDLGNAGAAAGAAGAGGAVGDPFIDAFTPPNPNVPQGTWNTPAIPGNMITRLVNSLIPGAGLTDADTGMIGKLLATGLGGVGASQKADASSNLYRDFMDLGKPYRDSLASLEANPAAYYQSPEIQGAQQQGSDAMARSLSATVGDPIFNKTALQEMQNYNQAGLLNQLNQRRSFLANAGGLGVGQAAGLGSQAAQSQGGVYNALGAGLGTVFGNQKDYASELLDILKNRGGSSGFSLS